MSALVYSFLLMMHSVSPGFWPEPTAPYGSPAPGALYVPPTPPPHHQPHCPPHNSHQPQR